MGISTHILDTALGKPAAGVAVALAVSDDGEWRELNRAETDADGRCMKMLPESEAMGAGVYRLRFETAQYYAAQQVRGLYPAIEITFEVLEGEQKYHIPLLLTANGYTTYRGS